VLFRSRYTAWLPRNPVGAAAAREMIESWNDPRQRGRRVGVLAALAGFVWTSRGDVLLATAMPAYLLTSMSWNQFGYDGPRHWMNVASGDDIRRDLLGKNVATASLVLAASVSIGAVAAAVRQDWGRLPLGLALLVATLGMRLGVGNVASVRVPVPVGDANATDKLAVAGRGGVWGPQFVVTGVVLLVTAVLFGLFLAGQNADRAAVVVAVVGLSLALGIGTWWGGFRAAVRHSGPRQPELLEKLGF
jgi:uncharacterized membrane protein